MYQAQLSSFHLVNLNKSNTMSQKYLRGVWKLMKQGGFFSSHQALGKYFVMGCYRFVWASRWASATLLAFSENPETRAQWSNILFEGAFSKSLKGKKCAMQMPLRYSCIKIEEITKITDYGHPERATLMLVYDCRPHFWL